MGRLLLAVLAVLAGCVSSHTAVPTPAGPIVVRHLEKFRVFGGEKLLGHLVLADIAGEHYYRVVTPSGIWVGDVQRHGRFFKSEPFRERPREIGLYTMNEGLGLLFETAASIRVLPMEGRGAPTEAAAHKLLRRALDPKTNK